MGCSNPDVPSYLHYDGKRKTYEDWRFTFWHLVYRTGFREKQNPIESDKMRTGYSVCWSKLIHHLDVLKTVLASNANLGNTVYFGKVSQLKKVVVKEVCDEGDLMGEHIVKIMVCHKPVPCNYSHSELLIQHIYPQNNIQQNRILQYADWQNSLFEKGKPPKFFKKLKTGYRAKVLTILNNELNNTNLPFYIRFHPKVAFMLLIAYFRFR